MSSLADHPKTDLTTLVGRLSREELSKSTKELAEQLEVTEYQLVTVLPETQVTLLDGVLAQPLLEDLPDWGRLTTIVLCRGSVFEFKGDFPRGKVAYGYYNLSGSDPLALGLHGHLHLSELTHIALLEKPFRGQIGYSMLFFAADGSCVFKVYLGRDSQRQLFPQQIERFQRLRADPLILTTTSIPYP